MPGDRDRRRCNAIYLAVRAAWLPAAGSTCYPGCYSRVILVTWTILYIYRVWQVLSAIDIMLPSDIGLGDVYPCIMMPQNYTCQQLSRRKMHTSIKEKCFSSCAQKLACLDNK